MEKDDLASVSLRGDDEENLVPPSLEDVERGLRPIRIGASRVRAVGVLDDALILAHVDPPYALFLLPDATGAPALPSKETIRTLLRTGQAQILPAMGKHVRPEIPAEKIIAICELLNAANVPNGTKSIEIWLHANWSEDLARRYGEFGNAHTIRKWRARLKRGAG